MNKRMQAIVKYMESGRGVIDVGTDHGYFPTWMASHGYKGNIIASDINASPLQKAMETAREAGVEDKIRFQLCDGLDSCPPDLVDTIVIAGMGGELIASILSRAPDLSGINLVLQPNTREPELYVWLRKNGYEIAAQKACEDGKFVYLVFKAHRAESKVPQECSELESIAGKLDIRLEESKKYIRRKINRIESAAAGMRKQCAFPPCRQLRRACRKAKGVSVGRRFA